MKTLSSKRMTDCHSITLETKKAWEENWENISIEEILGIFSYARVKKQMDVFMKYLPRDGIVFEGGCGLGPYVIRLRELGYNVIGSDYNLAPLAKSKRYDPQLPLVCGNVDYVPLRDNSIAAYLSLGVIEHFREGPEGAIRQAHRILKDDGVFIIKIPINNILRILHWPIDAIKRNHLIRRILKKPQKNFYWEQYFKPKYLRKILIKSGFEIEALIPVDHTHNLCTFCPGVFRDKNKFDEANALGLFIGNILEKSLPWSTASEAIFICRKKQY